MILVFKNIHSIIDIERLTAKIKLVQRVVQFIFKNNYDVTREYSPYAVVGDISFRSSDMTCVIHLTPEIKHNVERHLISGIIGIFLTFIAESD